MTTIDYAPPTPWFRRRKFRRIAIWFVALTLLGVAAWMWGPGVWRQMRIFYWQRQAMNYSEPPGKVRGEYGVGSLIEGCPTNDSFRETLEYPANMEWRGGDPIVFLHARRSKGGERLIGVSYDPFEHDSIHAPCFWIAICTPATLSTPASADMLGAYFPFQGRETRHLWPRIGDKVTVYAGQASATDEAEFEIRFDSVRASYVVKFRLSDDARNVETVSLEEDGRMADYLPAE